MRAVAGASVLALAAAGAALSQTAPARPAPAAEVSGCPWESVIADSDLGMSDHNATYLWSWFRVAPGAAITLRGRFPHARYMSLVIQDQDGTVIDSIDDLDIRADRGPNPFRAGVDRSRRDLGGYTLRVVGEPPPPGEHAPNTLYAGRSAKGEANELVMLNFRSYLSDRSVAKASGNPLWATGGVPAPELAVTGPAGERRACPPVGEARAAWRARQASTADQVRGVSAVPGQEAARNPPAWFHSERKSARGRATLGPNDNTVYISAPISSRFGDLLVLHWRPPSAPVGASLGQPFPPRSDVRYWSLSFMHKPPEATSFGGVRTERTVADEQVPRRSDGSARLVVGLGGRARPSSVVPAEWVGLRMSEGVIMVREIMSDPSYANDLGRLPRGPVPIERTAAAPTGAYASDSTLDKVLPGGVAQSAAPAARASEPRRGPGPAARGAGDRMGP